MKKDKSYTYLATDIAYHRNKLGRGFKSLVNIWGADHHGYIPRVQAVIQAFGHPKDSLHVLLVQLVAILRHGQPVPMSKRAGNFVTLRDVVQDVGADAARFIFLTRRSDSHLDFDLDVAKEQSRENPVYYVQYAHARLASLLREAESRSIAVPKKRGRLGIAPRPRGGAEHHQGPGQVSRGRRGSGAGLRAAPAYVLSAGPGRAAA